MGAHWSDKYIGRQYIKGEYDCAALVCEVCRDEFDVGEIEKIERAKSRLGRYEQIIAGVDEYACRTDAPKEGDVVLMICCGRPSHVGVYCRLGGEPMVLHALENAGQVVRHRLRDLERYFLKIEGFYRWKTTT